VQVEFRPEPIALHILYEDAHILVINKQPGLVAHPSPGHYSGTLVNALLYHCPDLVGIGGEIRPGIVHRLDKDTSGTMVVAKTASAHENLAHQFKTRKIQKTYLAIVYGEMQAEEGAIRLPIGRHPVDRKRMSTTSRKSRQAESRWRVQQRFQGITILEFDLKTGRTHQIRVHCAAINHPIVGDAVYGPHKLSKNKIKKSSSIPDTIADLVQTVRRQMLHAWRLGFTHPAENKIMTFESPIPSDMANLIDSLRCVG
jgi:23S rRNA pseudouridine1911/1915/1917 synthase